MPSLRRDEDTWIRAVAARFHAGPRVRVGVGHDAALVSMDGRDVVLKTDTVIDGVDFDLAECGGRAAGRKALAVTLSDLAAMAAVPRACVVSVVLPRHADFALFDAIGEGLAGAAEAFRCDVVGGDTSVADGPLVITVGAVGEPGPHGFTTRAGARPGDALSVTGALGGSILGRHLTFSPRLREAQVLMAHGIPRAMMDLSDGVSSDVPRLCAASGVGADLEAERIPVHEDALRVRDARSPLEHALDDGEDFELLLAHPPLGEAVLRRLTQENVTLHRIGTVTDHVGEVRLVEGGVARALPPGGYDHLRE